MIFTRRAAALTGSAALVLGLAGATGVAKADDGSMADAPTLTRAGLGALRTSAESEFFAGYVTSFDGPKTIVGTFTVPKLDCDGAPDSGIMSIIEIASTGGVDYADGAVFSYCLGGVATHNPVFDVSTGQVPIPEVVKNGDKIKVTSKAKSGEIKIKVKNLTQGWSAAHTATGVPAQEAASLQYRFDLGDGITLPAYDYGKVPVKGVEVSGKLLKKLSPTKYKMVVDGDLTVNPGKIKGGDFTYAHVG